MSFLDDFDKHCDECDLCSLIQSVFCRKGKALLDLAAHRAAATFRPIPIVLPRAKA